MSDSPDVMRALTVRRTHPPGGAPTGLVVPVELCPGARVYSFCLSAFRDPAVVGADFWAMLVLQDGEHIVWEDPSAIGGDLPGLAWPAYARLVVAPGVTATLHVTYGHCKP